MHSSSFIVALLPILAAAMPSPQIGQIPCGTHLGQMPCTADSGDTATTTVSSAASSPTPQTSVVSGDQSPESQWRSQNHNSDVVTCKSSWDCNSWCQGKMGGATTGWAVTCETWAPPGVSLDSMTGQCLCYKDDQVEQMLLGLGDAICLAVNDAAYDAAIFTSFLIPYVGEAADAGAALYRIGSKIVRKGAKDCGINVCPGHKYTVVDPEDFQSQVGILACD
ncbi:hypothetical protein PRZ48_012579 [Zasmidium cellare]|uniref:Uncharacterized protein n=1 Tax=Zasmidium cellare TaxID=395010 RepID=A0ABR0E599_ZASCE|nr:hypothetical protein PRZ48_012579 [Zasmidium cellare]